MFSFYFMGIQQDLKLAILAPVICAIFRLVFILVYRPKKNPLGEWRKWIECFRYGFWWGMDFNAYVFLFSMVLVSIPAAFIPAYYAIGDTVRLAGLMVYMVVIYTAFMGKMIFYFHFHDTFNTTMKLGRNADKKNLADIFFNQNHGGWILLGYIPYVCLCWLMGSALLSLPSINYVECGALWSQYLLNTLIFLGAIIFFYWVRYGGTLNHRNKPEWDEVPTLVKDDIFMGKATIDDLVAFELACKREVCDSLRHDDSEAAAIMEPILSEKLASGASPLEMFKHRAKGARIQKPKHIFFLLGESHGQSPFDEPFHYLHLMDASMRFRKETNAVVMDNFLPAGLISQPSLVSLLAGIYDADLELNENKDFWYGTVPTSMPLQLKKLGYRTEFWYGGGLNWGSLEHFAPAVGFDRCHGGPDFCPPDSPKTWLGVYDHIFLEEAARLIQKTDDDQPVFHFIYTTSNHGPYNMPYEKYGFDVEKVMPEVPEKLKRNHKVMKQMGGIWYADQALIHFAEQMREVYPDSLFIVTGDHTINMIPYKCDVIERHEPNQREILLTSFAMIHPELTKEILNGNTIGGHMNIMPTIIELIAPKGYEYYSIAKPLTEAIDHVVTPYCWMTKDTLGDYRYSWAQDLRVSEKLLPVEQERVMFAEERNAWCELTGWMVRHPELLGDAGVGNKI